MSEHKILGLTESCSGCFACMNICPKEAISMPENEEGFYSPSIDSSKCVDCGLCDKVCPQIEKKETYRMQNAYYGWAKDDNIRKSSSSGGVFTHLAKIVLDNGGVVYGAAFNYDGLIRLECHSTDEVSLSELQRSKYVQSYIGYAYREIKDILRNGRQVLFCGTPCQVAALKSFLNKKYDNLLLIDFVCHGVPSMDLLRKHLEYLGIKNVVDINFRPKNTSWVDDIEITYKKKSASPIFKKHRREWRVDEYFYTFQRYRSIRRSCRRCLYCNGDRAADITIADFWGVRRYKPELYDKRGISMILANNNQGLTYIGTLKGTASFEIYDLPLEYAEYAYERVRTDKNSPYQDPKRDEFLRDVYNLGYVKSIKKHGFYTSQTFIFKRKLINVIKRLISRNNSSLIL